MTVRCLGFCLVISVFLSASAAAVPFRIRKALVEGADLVLFHEAPDAEASDTARITLGGRPCAPVEGQVRLPGRGGEPLTLVFVVDRGGTAQAGMGRYSTEIKQALDQLISEASRSAPGTRFALVDAPGRLVGFRELEPTEDLTAIRVFLDAMPPPAGSGADIYGAARHGLGVIKRASGRLRGVVLISDGIDPLAGGEGGADQQTELVREAKAAGVPLNAIYVNRHGEVGTTASAAATMQRGLGRLRAVVDQTGGDLRSVNAPDQITRQLNDQLGKFGSEYLALQRTSCRICGDFGRPGTQVIDFEVVRGAEVVTRSQPEPPPQVELVRTDFGACEVVDADASLDKLPDTKASKGGDGQNKRLMLGAVGGLLALGIVVALIFRQKRPVAQREAAKQAPPEKRPKPEVVPPTVVSKLPEVIAPAVVLQQPAPSAVLHRWRLVSLPHSELRLDRTLEEGVSTIGSMPPADLVFDFPNISGVHAEITVREGLVTLRDLGSSNGTFVNGIRLTPQAAIEVRVGDQIGFSRKVAVVLEGPPAPPSNHRTRTRLDA